MTRLQIAAAARNDLRDIRNYSKVAHGADTARNYLKGLRATFTRLRDKPMIGVAEGQLGPDMRSFPFPAHRIYFRVMNEDILIVRILHHARDVTRNMDATH